MARLLLAAVFIVSAVAKLFAIDDFELYIYSYGFVSLNVSYLVARLCIATEMVLGVLLALGWWPKAVRVLVLAMLLFFSMFLCYAALAGRNDSCQCFGRLADFSPAQSLLKNAVLIVLTLFCDGSQGVVGKGLKAKKPVAAGVAVAVLVAVFCISVPDNWMFGPEEGRFNRGLLEAAMAPDGALADNRLDEGHQLVAFVTPGCPYCRMTREKIGSMAKRNHLDTSRIQYIEPQDLPDMLFFEITYGQRPLILLLDHGVPTATYHYRNINERQVANFLR